MYYRMNTYSESNIGVTKYSQKLQRTDRSILYRSFLGFGYVFFFILKNYAYELCIHASVISQNILCSMTNRILHYNIRRGASRLGAVIDFYIIRCYGSLGML